MGFEDLRASGPLVKTLSGMLDSGRLPGALLLHEDDGGGALPLALAFLGRLFGEESRVGRLIHPDVHYFYPVASGSKVSEKTDALKASLFFRYWQALVAQKPYFTEQELYEAFGVQGKQVQLGIAQAREILDTASLSPVEGGYVALVIYLPEKMNLACANKLLKLLEEPPRKTLFVMISHDPGRMLPTVLSRCQLFRVEPLPREMIAKALMDMGQVSEAEADSYAAWAGGSLGRALALLSDAENSARQEELLRGLFSALAARDLGKALDTGEALAALGSKERQKAFCGYAAGAARRLFLVQQGLERLASLPSSQEAYYASVAASCKKTFPRQASVLLGRAAQMLERNVNPKILFADLAAKLYMVF